MSNSSQDNPIVKIIGKIKIRVSNNVQLRYGAIEYEELATQAIESGLSIKKLIALKSQPCQACGCDKAAIEVSLKKSPKTMSSGVTLHQKNL